jgi:SAM-dependent methyltransferase
VEASRQAARAAEEARQRAGSPPDELMQRVRGFQESRVVLTAIELDLFTAVGDGAGAGEVAGRLGASGRGTRMLLDALAALELLEKRGDTYYNAPLAARYLAAGGPGDARAGLMHSVHQWSRWSTLTEAVRAGEAVDYTEMDQRGERWTTAFIAAMHRNATARAPEAAGALDLSGVRRMLDLGGGSGAYSIAFAERQPQLAAEVLDLEPVLPLTQGYVEAAGLEDRITTRPGDLRADDLGEGFDLVWISAICHMLGPDENRDLLQRAFAALAGGGQVAVQDFVLEEDRTRPAPAALFALNMLVSTPAGSSYSEGDYAGWLREAGFEAVQRRRLPGPTDLMVARRPRG